MCFDWDFGVTHSFTFFAQSLVKWHMHYIWRQREEQRNAFFLVEFSLVGSTAFWKNRCAANEYGAGNVYLWKLD